MKHQARKRFGQNFLNDQSVITDIVRVINPQPSDALVEIGPGLGALTQPLLTEINQLTAIELDRDLIERLQNLADADRLTLLNADALQFDFSSLASEHKLRIVGNLPYNISSPLLFHLLHQLDSIQDMHFMLQKEVIDRIVAEPSTRTYGRLSVMFQHYCDAEPLLEVPPDAFSPPPKVQSAVVRLTPLSVASPDVAFKTLERVVQMAFATRRKTLRNNFKQHLPAEAMESIDIDWTARPETLSVKEFASFALACEPFLATI